jgi:hypothetical protein
MSIQAVCEAIKAAGGRALLVGGAVRHGLNVVVSNTFLTLGEMNVYLAMARRHCYTVKIKTLHGKYGSVHNVPVEKQRAMEARLQELNQAWLSSHGAQEA